MPKTILIIDDDQIIVKYLENIFQDNGYATLSATNGIEAAEMVKKNKPDLITLDLQMPEEWGPRFYRKLTKDKEFKGIPVIVISGLSSSKYSLPKALGHLGKPFDVDELLNLVKDAIGEGEKE
jgi:CheY-like chemotaxis protein